MNYQSNEQLSEMKLHAMRLEYQRQQELPAISDLDFDERFSMIVNEQYNAKKDAKSRRLIKAANLREPTANLANIDYDPVRKIKKADIARLSNCEWIQSGANLIITGATGVGKTYLLSAFWDTKSYWDRSRKCNHSGHIQQRRYNDHASSKNCYLYY